MDLFSTSNIRRLKYTLGIWAPDADKITEQCREAFHKNIPFACLVPNDLVEYIAMDNKGQLEKRYITTTANNADALIALINEKSSKT